MKKGLALLLSLGGIVLLIIGLLGAFGKMQLGTTAWILLILGIIFFPSGIALMRSASSSDG